jgi:hypothetical protein
MVYRKKRCPFLKGKRGDRFYYCRDYKCMIQSAIFNNAKKYGCTSLDHLKCEHYLKALDDLLWQSYVREKGYLKKEQLS